MEIQYFQSAKFCISNLNSVASVIMYLVCAALDEIVCKKLINADFCQSSSGNTWVWFLTATTKYMYSTWQFTERVV